MFISFLLLALSMREKYPPDFQHLSWGYVFEYIWNFKLFNIKLVLRFQPKDFFVNKQEILLDDVLYLNNPCGPLPPLQTAHTFCHLVTTSSFPSDTHHNKVSMYVIHSSLSVPTLFLLKFLSDIHTRSHTYSIYPS